MNNKIFLILIAAMLTLPGCANLVQDLRNAVDVSGVIKVKGENASLTLYFSDADKRNILDFYQGRKSKSKKTPPGLAKRKNLPPGLQKQIERNGRLPPGLQGRGLPGDLERRLDRLPGGYVRLVVEKDIVLMNEKTGIVLDVIIGVVL